MAEITARNSGSRKSGSRRVPIKIDMTPMVDLAFLLLTFFMLTQSFNTQFALDIESPPAPNGEGEPTPPNKIVTVILGENNAIYWYQGIEDTEFFTSNFSVQGIRSVFARKKEEIGDVVILIKPSDKSNYKNLIDIFDEISLAKIKQYAIAKVTETDKELMSKNK